MDELADDGIMMYFLEMPTFPLLDDKCDANQVLDSFIFGDYMSTKVLLEAFFTMAMPGDSMRRKQEDLDSAVCNMMSGYQRTAARNWFSLLESEHKKCAEVLAHRQSRLQIIHIAGEIDRSAKRNHHPARNAAKYFFQHMVIFSSDFTISPIT